VQKINNSINDGNRVATRGFFKKYNKKVTGWVIQENYGIIGVLSGWLKWFYVWSINCV
jgi:hypothetical protein